MARHQGPDGRGPVTLRAGRYQGRGRRGSMHRPFSCGWLTNMTPRKSGARWRLLASGQTLWPTTFQPLPTLAFAAMKSLKPNLHILVAPSKPRQTLRQCRSPKHQFFGGEQCSGVVLPNKYQPSRALREQPLAMRLLTPSLWQLSRPIRHSLIFRPFN